MGWQIVDNHDGARHCGTIPSRNAGWIDTLKSQGLQANQDVTFLTDGGEEVGALTELVTPASEHVLDWFHITMRLTVLAQYARGVAHHDEAAGTNPLTDLERVKWLLWHGNQHRAGETLGFFVDDVDALSSTIPTCTSSLARRTSSASTSPPTPAA